MINFSSYFNSIFLGSLRSLSDIEWQKRGWGGGDNPSKYIGFDEIVMEFMDSCEIVLTRPEKYHLSLSQQQSMKKLFAMLDEYCSNEKRPNNERDIIDDPEWDKIRKFAKKVYNDLKDVKYNEN